MQIKATTAFRFARHPRLQAPGSSCARAEASTEKKNEADCEEKKKKTIDGKFFIWATHNCHQWNTDNMRMLTFAG